MLKRIFNRIKREYIYYSKINSVKKAGILIEQPNYLYDPNFRNDPIIVDVGCAGDPDFSRHMINKYGFKSYGVDPTKKHFKDLEMFTQKMGGKFKHLPYAVADQEATLTFHESVNFDSGSLMNSHSNVVKDDTNTYQVQALTIGALKDKIKCDEIDYLKLDLEGIEYSLIDKISEKDLKYCKQLFVEFHHHCIKEYSIEDTQKCVQKIEKIGFKSYTLDNHNYLFIRT